MEAPLIQEKTPAKHPFEDNVVYVSLVVISLYLFTRVIEIRLGHIFVLLVAYIGITHMRKQAEETDLTFNAEIDFRLDQLGAPSHFHTDINMINFFYDIYDWRKYNERDFDAMLKAANNVLHIEEDTSLVDLQGCVDNYDVAYDQMKIALNLLHGFVYNLDHPEKIKKLKIMLQRLMQLMQRHLQKIQRNCEATKRPINVRTRFINDAFAPKPFDPIAAQLLDFY